MRRTEKQVSGMWGKGGAYLCAPNMVSIVYYLVTLKSPFVMPMNFFGFEKRNKWLFV